MSQQSLWTAVAGNGTAALIGFALSLVVVRALGVSDYGLYGMLAAVAGICTNALDLRLGDATMRWFFAHRADPEERDERGRALAILLAGAIAQAAVAAAIGVATVIGALVLLPRLSRADLPAWAVLAFAASEVVSHVARFLIFTLRLTGKISDLVRCDLLVAGVRAVIVGAAVLLHPSLLGFIVGLALGGLSSLSIASLSFCRVWVGRMRLRTSPGVVRAEVRGLLGRRRELFSLGAINYQNLLHRAADVLVVGLVAGEREAGIYKLARSMTDALYVLYDAAGKTYQPRLLELVHLGRWDELRAFAGRSLRLTGFAVAVLLLLEAIFLEPLLGAFFGPGFTAARVPILLFSAASFFVFGLYLWAWPLVVAERRVGSYAATAFLAVLVGQYALGLGGVLLGVGASASWFALAYLASYFLLWAAFGPKAEALLRGRVDAPAAAVSMAEGRP